jgi:hypothetical protein
MKDVKWVLVQCSGVTEVTKVNQLAQFMVDITKGFIRFAIKRAKTVGGSVEIAAITKA